MASAVSDFSNIMTRIPMGPVVRSIEYRDALFQLWNRETGRLAPQAGADYATINYFDSLDITAGGRTETGNVILPGKASTSQARVYPKEVTGSVGWTQWQQDLLSQNPNAFVGYITDMMKAFIPGMRWVHQCIMAGDGTGRLAKVSACTDNTTSWDITVNNTAEAFGWDLCDRIRNGMVVDVYTVAGIGTTSDWTALGKHLVVSLLDRVAGTFRLTANAGDSVSALTTAPTVFSVDYVFLADSAQVNSSTTHFEGWNLPHGLYSIIDDGQDVGNEFAPSGNLYNHCWYGTRQNKATATYAYYKSLISRANNRGGVKGTKQGTSVDEVAEIVRWLMEESDAGNPERLAILGKGKVVDWLGRLSLNSKNGMVVLNEAQEIVPGLRTKEVFVTSNGDIPIHRVDMMPDHSLTFVNWADLYRWEVVPMQMVPYAPGGGNQFPTPGTRNLAYESWLRFFGANWFTRADRCARLEDIDTDIV